jgi:hypothetical protein
MEDDIQSQPGKIHTWYMQLDRFLLYLLSAELGISFFSCLPALFSLFSFTPSMCLR